MNGGFDLVDLFRILLLSVLVLCAVFAVCSKKLLTTVVVYMSYSAVMAILWMLLRSPDLAITEAAGGRGRVLDPFLPLPAEDRQHRRTG